MKAINCEGSNANPDQPRVWSILASISTILGFAVLIWAAIVALSQLKEMTKARHLDAMMQVHEMLASVEARNHRKYIYTKLKSNPEKLTAKEREHVEQVSVAFDRIGNLVEYGLVPRDVLFDSHCEVIIRIWQKLEPYILHHRQMIGGRHVEHFEKLAVAAQKYHSKHFPGQVLNTIDLSSKTVKPKDKSA